MRELGVGRALPRSEDLRLLSGRGRFTDDMSFADQCFMVVLRSPHAHARVRTIDSREALEMPGVITVLTGADAQADGIGMIRTMVQRHKADGSPMERPPYRVLALDTVRMVGDAVAVVLAEHPAQARDAAERIIVDYEQLPSVSDVVDAMAYGAPAVWPDLVPDNICFEFQLGDRAAVERAFAQAAHVSRLDFRISRVTANTLEPRNAIASYDAFDDRYTLIAGVQNPHRLRAEIAQHALFIPASKLRLVSPDMGGGFGMKGSVFPELVLSLWAARRSGRTVRWQADRGESFLSDYHARDNVSTVELALDEDGIFLALRIRTLANLGAYLGFNTPHSSTNNLGGLAGTYRTPAIHAHVLGLYTNTQPTAPYRGAGRPEASFAIERIIDLAAREHGFDPIALRRRNLIASSQMPYKTGLVFTYDCGEFERNMDDAMRLADYAGFETRRALAASQGRLRGFGMANAIEIAGGPQGNPNEEACEIRFDENGDLTVLLGTHNHGQGHETVFRQIAHEILGIAPERISILCGDTDLVLHGKGTFGSRSITAAGTAFVRASEKIIERGRHIAAHLLEADAGDIEFDGGDFRVAGTDRLIRLEAVARASFVAGRLPADLPMGLIEQSVAVQDDANFPNGCHACELEIDPQTGALMLLSYVVVDDVGTVINPLLLKGQIHGGIAQGYGQAAIEAIRFDPDSGQLLTGSFMDYAMPRADEFPQIVVHSNPVPTSRNPLGAKGAGEAGTVGALPAIVNAAVDALKSFGIRHLDMPLTPHRIWQAIRDHGGS